MEGLASELELGWGWVFANVTLLLAGAVLVLKLLEFPQKWRGLERPVGGLFLALGILLVPQPRSYAG